MRFLLIVNMSKIYSQWIKILAVIILCMKVSNAQRRITNGQRVYGEKRYMVYLLQAPPHNYSGWTCGGVIITSFYILTSASCVATAPQSYVISGYRKYVNARYMHKDECIMRNRRKIISYCHPYGFSSGYLYYQYPYWTIGDIGVAKVDVPFDFNDQSYYEFCSYPPATIDVNYHFQLHRSGTDIINLGWGHTRYYRPEGEKMDLNEEYLRYSSGTITANDDCKSIHENAFYNVDFSRQLRQYWICVNDPGNLDENGNFITENRDFHNTCNNTYDPSTFDNYGRQNAVNITEDKDCFDGDVLRAGSITNITNERTGGFCQNDHGGPLVAWIGGRETVIGVANLFAVADDWRCRTPYLYTATASINKILACFIWTNFTSYRKRSMYCDDVKTEMNFTDKHVTWTDDI